MTTARSIAAVSVAGGVVIRATRRLPEVDMSEANEKPGLEVRVSFSGVVESEVSIVRRPETQDPLAIVQIGSLELVVGGERAMDALEQLSRRALELALRLPLSAQPGAVPVTPVNRAATVAITAQHAAAALIGVIDRDGMPVLRARIGPLGLECRDRLAVYSIGAAVGIAHQELRAALKTETSRDAARKAAPTPQHKRGPRRHAPRRNGAAPVRRQSRGPERGR